MLEKFKKLFAVTEPVVEAAHPDVAELVVSNEAFAALTTEFEAFKAEATSLLSVAETQLAELTAKYEGAQAALLAIASEKEQMIAEAAAAKLVARKEKVVAAIGTEKADGLMAATEGLEDAAFEAVVSALAGSIEAEAKTGLFVEQGVAAEVDATKVVEESKEMKLLKQKYPSAK